MTTAGDIVYATAANAVARLGIGAAGSILRAGASAPIWGFADPSVGIGYSAGAGGSVTQLTSKSTAVTLNKVCGQILTHNAALAAGAEVGFNVNNSVVTNTDVVIIGHDAGDVYGICITEMSAGFFAISLTNLSAGSLSDAITINFAVIKAVIT